MFFNYIDLWTIIAIHCMCIFSRLLIPISIGRQHQIYPMILSFSFALWLIVLHTHNMTTKRLWNVERSMYSSNVDASLYNENSINLACFIIFSNKYSSFIQEYDFFLLWCLCSVITLIKIQMLDCVTTDMILEHGHIPKLYDFSSSFYPLWNFCMYKIFL